MMPWSSSQNTNPVVTNSRWNQLVSLESAAVNAQSKSKGPRIAVKAAKAHQRRPTLPLYSGASPLSELKNEVRSSNVPRANRNRTKPRKATPVPRSLKGQIWLDDGRLLPPTSVIPNHVIALPMEVGSSVEIA